MERIEHMPGSEVARIREQIDTEIEAMKRGLYGVAEGTSRHRFIQARLQRVGELMVTLTSHIGEQEARDISCSAYIRIMSEEEK
jgi:hypothetical protein